MARRISSPVLVGREAELRTFERSLEEAAARRPSVFVIGGEAGIGKSRLVAEFAARTKAAGGLAAVGAALPPAGTATIPLAAVVQALRGLVRAIDVRLLDHVLGPARGDLAALLPELGTPSPQPVSPPFAAARLAEAILVALEAVAARRPATLFALEDLHWLDDATAAILLYLCRNLVDAPVVLVLTHRSDHPRDAGGFLDVLAEVGRGPNVERLHLAPLAPQEALKQVEAIAGPDLPESRLREIVRRSDGVPFFIEELVLESAEGGPGELPASIRAAVDARLGSLGTAARSLVVTLAAAGAPLSLDELAAAASVAPGELDAALDELRLVHLISDAPGRPDGGPGLDIRHVLLREAIEHGLPDGRRRDIHARLAQALERVPAATTGVAPDLEWSSATARHWLLAGDDARASAALVREAEAAEAAHAFAAAAEAYRAALGAMDRATRQALGREPDSSPLPDRASILERAAQAASLAGRPADAIVAAREALRTEPAQSAAADPERIARLTMHLGRFLAEAGQTLEAIAALETALRGPGAGPLLRARAATSLARLFVSVGRVAEALERADEAVALAGGPGGRDRELAQAHSARAVALAGLGRSGEAMVALRAAADAAGRPSEATWPTRPSRIAAELRGFLDRADVLERAGDLAGAAHMAEQGMRAAEARGLAATQGAVLAATAARDLARTGDLDGALRMLATLGPQGRAVREVRLVEARLAARRGDWESVAASLADDQATSTLPLERGWAADAALAAAEAACWRRRWLEARDTVRAGSETAAAERERDTLLELAVLGIRVEADALAHGARRRDAAGSAMRELATEHWIALQAATTAPTGVATARERAILATAAAELARMTAASDAGAAWQGALAAWDRAGNSYEGAYCRWRLAEALVGARSDREAARAALLDAVGVAGRLGAEPLAREAEALARRARLVDKGRTTAGAGEGAIPGSARARELGLSDREIEVLRLIAEGLTDREIGQRLFITPKTVGHHVSSILAKLALDRRGEAAALAFRIGLVEPER